MPKGENEDDPLDVRPKPCGAVLGNTAELDNEEAKEGGEVNLGGGDDILA
jgi:hypothetical protein